MGRVGGLGGVTGRRTGIVVLALVVRGRGGILVHVVVCGRSGGGRIVIGRDVI